jgi:Uncharacterized protein conserved in bacteria (DUF2188)
VKSRDDGSAARPQSTAFCQPPDNEKYPMTKLIYEIIQHDGGWAYKADGVFSESYSTHDQARAAAERAAAMQSVPGEEADISYEDKEGHWHTEHASGDDRPETDVKG